MRNFLIVIFVGASWSSIAQAACANPAGVSGQVQYFSPVMKFCDGYDWQLFTIASTTGGCAPSGSFTTSGGDLALCENGSLNLVSDLGLDGVCSDTGKLQTRNSSIQWCNGTNWQKIIDLNTCVPGTQTFTSGSGNFTVPTHCKHVVVEAWGAGGAGRAARFGSGRYYEGLGGKAGDYANTAVTTVGGESYAYSVGVGGAGVGGNTTAATLTAPGGTLSGDLQIGQVSCTTSTAGTNGGSSVFGAGGAGGSPGSAGAAGVGAGSGGGGGGLNCTGPAYGAGGAGASGAVRFSYYPCNMNWENLPATTNWTTSSARNLCGSMTALYINTGAGAGDFQYRKNGGVWTTVNFQATVPAVEGDSFEFRTSNLNSYPTNSETAVIRENNASGAVIDTFSWVSNSDA